MTQVLADVVRRSVTFGDVPLAQLRLSHIQAWLKSMTAKDYASNTVHTRVQTVRAAVNAAILDRRITTDPAVGLKLSRRGARERTMQVATSDQVGRLIAAS